MSKVPLSAGVVRSVLPLPDLEDLTQTSSEIDNDIAYLLSWLAPCFPPSLLSSPDASWTLPLAQINRNFNKVRDPSPRVKAAFRSCLKDPSNQVEFVRLYINTININCDRFFDSLAARPVPLPFIDLVAVIQTITTYFKTHSAYLNLSSLSRDLLNRNLNAIFYTRLVAPSHSTFLGDIHNLLNSTMFDSSALSNSPSHSSASSSINPIDILSTLFSIGLGPQIHSILVQLSTQIIRNFVQCTCKGKWDSSIIHLIDGFVQDQVYPNFSVIISITGHSSLSDESNGMHYYELIKIAHDELVALRSTEVYDLVLAYPTSFLALRELHQCLLVRYNHQDFHSAPITDSSISAKPGNGNPSFQTDVPGASKAAFMASSSIKVRALQRVRIVDNFIDACRKRLLHAGANTVDVITTYVKTIRSFLVIDPQGVLLDKVVRPIRIYLKTRHDVISKLVQGLLAESIDTNPLVELASELRASTGSSSLLVPRKDHSALDPDDTQDLNWVPDPIDALPDFKREKVTDVIESLISIFDTKDVLIEEFTKILGERLLAVHHYDISNIVGQLDLLKSRFGKNEFATLDIMVQDILDSSQVNDQIHRSQLAHPSFHASILSHMYWPSIAGQNIPLAFKVGDLVEKRFELFNRGYSKIKQGRKLKLVPQLGTVTLELDFAGKSSISFTVSPDKAAIILLLDNDRTEISIDLVKEKLEMNHYMAVKGLEFWAQQGVLIALTKSLYVVNEDEDALDAEVMVSAKTISTAGGTPEFPASVSPLSALLPQIISVLDNFKSLSSKRLRSLLELTILKETFSFEGLSQSDWEDYLDLLVDEGRLRIHDGKYCLNPPN